MARTERQTGLGGAIGVPQSAGTACLPLAAVSPVCGAHLCIAANAGRTGLSDSSAFSPERAHFHANRRDAAAGAPPRNP